MSNTVFIDYQTPILASWLNDVNKITYVNLAGALNSISYTDTGVLGQFSGSSNGYQQLVIQNTNAGTSASSDVVVSNNLSTSSSYYGNFGINSSTFMGSGSLSTPNAVYLTSTSGQLVIGTTTSNGISFVVNNSSTDALTISSTGSITVPKLGTGLAKVTSGTIGVATSSDIVSAIGGTAVTNATNVTGTIASSVTAVTQSVGDNSTKVATTAFVLANTSSGISPYIYTQLL